VEAVRNTRLQALLRDVLTADTTLEGEAELLAPQKRVLKLTGAPLRDESGREIGCVAVLNDVTHLRALERMRSEFVANVSHELKTPITAVKGYIETLREGAIAEPANAAKFLDIIAQHADRLNAIVDDLLSLSRIESDAHSITLEPLDLRRVVAHSLGNYRGKAAAKKIGIQGPEAGDPLPILGNANLLEQAVGNILDNAIKFSPEGTNVRVSLAKGAGAVTLEVADQGIGISERDLPRIFERFYRADKGRSRELSAGGGPASGGGGTGLGLAIVKHIILAHKGEVSARSTLGKGSVFTIRLPLAASV
jgi:two-component system phosphate regulon sensor histidine kinase PhoR